MHDAIAICTYPNPSHHCSPCTFHLHNFQLDNIWRIEKCVLVRAYNTHKSGQHKFTSRNNNKNNRKIKLFFSLFKYLSVRQREKQKHMYVILMFSLQICKRFFCIILLFFIVVAVILFCWKTSSSSVLLEELLFRNSSDIFWYLSVRVLDSLAVIVQNFFLNLLLALVEVELSIP